MDYNMSDSENSDLSIKNSFKSVQDIAFEKLRDFILSGRLKPGDPLNTIELSKILGVSRTPIREAINRLKSIGLVEAIPHKGAFVQQLSVKEVIEIYYIRAALSGACARLAVKNLSIKMKQKLLNLCDEMETAVAREEHDLMLKRNMELHRIIYKAAESPRLEALVLQFYSQSDHYRALGLELPGRYEEICIEHRNIVNALLEDDKDKAEFFSKEHHLNTARRIAKSFGVEIDI